MLKKNSNEQLLRPLPKKTKHHVQKPSKASPIHHDLEQHSESSIPTVFRSHKLLQLRLPLLLQ